MISDAYQPPPCFRNPKGYTLSIVTGSRKFEFQLDLLAPLTYLDGAGNDYEPDRHFWTDLGSVPWCEEWVPGYSRNRLAFIFHDSTYNTVPGLGHGLYVRAPGFHEFRWVALTRRQSDDLMRVMLLAEGVRPSTARCIWAAVRVFGRRW